VTDMTIGQDEDSVASAGPLDRTAQAAAARGLVGAPIPLTPVPAARRSRRRHPPLDQQVQQTLH
jgi:hypothetical protein